MYLQWLNLCQKLHGQRSSITRHQQASPAKLGIVPSIEQLIATLRLVYLFGTDEVLRAWQFECVNLLECAVYKRMCMGRLWIARAGPIDECRATWKLPVMQAQQGGAFSLQERQLEVVALLNQSRKNDKLKVFPLHMPRYYETQKSLSESKTTLDANGWEDLYVLSDVLRKRLARLSC